MGSHKLRHKEVAQILEDFLAGTGGKWAWDDFISIPIEDEALERIRIRCSGLDSEFPPLEKGHFCNEEGLDVIRGFLGDLRTRRIPIGEG